MRLALTRGDGWATMGTAQRGADPRAWWRGVTAAAHRFEKIAADDGGVSAGFRRFLDLESGAGRAIPTQ